MAVQWLMGCEHGQISAVGAGLFDTLTTPANITADTANVPGAWSKYSLKISKPVTTLVNARKNAIGTPAGIALSGRIMFPSLPAADVLELLRWTYSGGSAGQLAFQQSTSKFGIADGSTPTTIGTVGSVTVVAGQWHQIDLKILQDATNIKIDWSVDGVTQTQATHAATAQTIAVAGFFGSALAADVFTAYFDDWYCNDDTTLYPIGAVRVNGLHPTSDGTHSPATPDCFQDSSSVLISSSNLGFQYEDDDPFPAPTPATDLIKQINGTTPHDTHYLEFNLADMPSAGTVKAVQGYCEVHNVSLATANLIIVRTVGTGAGTTDIFNGTIGSASSLFKTAIIAAPGTGWTVATVNELVARMGLSNDVAPVPTVGAIMLEVAYTAPAAGPLPQPVILRQAVKLASVW